MSDKHDSAKSTSLPTTRVRMIMKSSPEVTAISQEALYLITLATEYFVEHLALMALHNSDEAYSVEYRDLAAVVNLRSTLEFLQDIIPKKITAGEYLEILKKEVKITEDDYL